MSSFHCCGTLPHPLQIQTTISSSLRRRAESPLRGILNGSTETLSCPTAFPFANERMASVSSDRSCANVERAERELVHPRTRPGGLVFHAGGLPHRPLPPSLFRSNALRISLSSRCLPRFLPWFFRRVGCGTPTTPRLLHRRHFSLFIMDVPRTNLHRVFDTQGLEALEESPLIAPAQLLLQTLDVFLKEPCFCSVTDPLNMRVGSPDSSFQLTALRVSLLPLPGCSSRGHRHVELCFGLGVTPLCPPRACTLAAAQPALLFAVRCCKGSLHIINTAAARGYRPPNHCRYLLAQMGVVRQPSPVDRRRFFSPSHWRVASKATKQFYICYGVVAVQNGQK